MIRIKFINFWKDFDYKKNFITDLLNIYNINFTVVDNNIDYLIVGSFINNDSDKNTLKSYPIKTKKILFISEPIEIFFPHTYELFINNEFTYVFGSVNNLYKNDKQIHYKFPLYMLYFDYKNSNLYSDTNTYVLNQEIIQNKQIICLINSHDHRNSRTPIYMNLLRKGININCPGKLFNNSSNEELNSIGKFEYLKKFIFNICPENTKTLPKGYITEKLLQSCMAGCIPIYCGSFDEIDEKIFNKNRILFYDYESDESVNYCGIQVFNLINDNNKLETFYKQPPFNDTALQTLINLENNFFNIFR
jgi:hypothetical protein